MHAIGEFCSLSRQTWIGWENFLSRLSTLCHDRVDYGREIPIMTWLSKMGRNFVATEDFQVTTDLRTIEELCHSRQRLERTTSVRARLG